LIKAAVFYGKQGMRLSEVSLDSPVNGAVIVRVKACGLCGTDLHNRSGIPGRHGVGIFE
jgi:threonine dehydrogenase-like Zn-dependent dehydrogenase